MFVVRGVAGFALPRSGACFAVAFECLVGHGVILGAQKGRHEGCFSSRKFKACATKPQHQPARVTKVILHCGPSGGIDGLQSMGVFFSAAGCRIDEGRLYFACDGHKEGNAMVVVLVFPRFVFRIVPADAKRTWSY